jgi:hypothetical protein
LFCAVGIHNPTKQMALAAGQRVVEGVPFSCMALHNGCLSILVAVHGWIPCRATELDIEFAFE